MNERGVLLGGLETLGLDLRAEQVDALLNYMALIQKWNKVYNLTAVRHSADMLTHHLLDSLAAVLPLRAQLQNMGLTEGRLLDVGSGGGLPGVVLAIAMPHWRVTCVDTVAKKAAFVQQVSASLGLGNLRGLHARVESLNAEAGEGYDVVVARAFASLPDFVNWSANAVLPHGVWMAMKGKLPTEEMAALPELAQVFHVEPLHVPGLDAERCVVWMRPTNGVVNHLT
jgi:16S rRNA (guanine527-N7)-methyltransferase